MSKEDLSNEEREALDQEVIQEQEQDENFVKIPRKDFDTLKRNLAKANKSDEKRRKELEEYTKYGTLEDLESLTERLEAAESGQGAAVDEEVINRKLEKQRRELERKFQTDLSAKEKEVQDFQRKIEETVFLSQAREAIVKHGGAAELLLDPVRKAAKVYEKDGSFVTSVVDEDGEQRFNNKGEYMQLEDLVLELKEHEVYGRAFDAPRKSGAGNRNQSESGSKRNNPAHGLKKSAMTLNEKQDFIAEHGFAKYQEIPQ